MDVFIFDTKRNLSVQKGRRQKERASKEQQESIVDLELDYLAPYLERFPDVESITKAQALEVHTCRMAPQDTTRHASMK